MKAEDAMHLFKDNANIVAASKKGKSIYALEYYPHNGHYDFVNFSMGWGEYGPMLSHEQAAPLLEKLKSNQTLHDLYGEIQAMHFLR